SVAKHGDAFVCDWEYCTDLFHPDTITRMTEHFEVLLVGIINKPEQTISQLPLLTETEQEQLQTWNQTETDYPEELTIVDLFEERVKKTPDNIALVFEDQQLSYRELNRKANQLAHYLISLKTGNDNGPLIADNSLVGICVERSLEMVIGLLGILKAGNAYVPFDSEYPLLRLQFMLDNSSVPVMLSQSHLLERLSLPKTKVVCLDSEWEQIETYSGKNPARQSGPKDLAYVIYTSGSTGKPKGVMVEHLGLANIIQAQVQKFDIQTGSQILQFVSLCFDVATADIAMTLFQGATLHLLPKQSIVVGENLLSQLRQRKITHLQIPVSVLSTLVLEELPDLQVIIVGGDVCTSELVTKWSKGRKFINAYGPTESTVCVSLNECKDDGNSPLIGKPIANTHIYILDSDHNPAPPRIPGELCIAGRGLARGYLNHPGLTIEKFIEIEIFGKRQRLYKTGDLARWLPDGNLEFLGRLDNQVKLRGFRIELSEIEVNLSQHEAVKEAVVVLHNKKDNPCLAAYVTLAMSIDEVAGILRTWLKSRLPEYMLPSNFTVLDKLPLTPNGKIDCKALPVPDLTTFTGTYEAPRTDTEERLVEVWNHVLRQTTIGIHDN
ncbi:MAG: amino acid adenylation domain-containing protein, partial [Gammaproteobacteria bacterium]|nr:amino acid adenylation domain-containing protein [Gammaproteobacteria bacterium]